MLEIIKNKTLFPDTDLVKMVKRDNNPKRNYLLVNSRQGKHIPTDPEQVSYLCTTLAGEIKKSIETEKILFIGFAETATAIGAMTAARFINSYYIHTTREKDETRTPVAVFSEEHSHATEQYLYCDDWDKVIKGLRYIVFIDDEVTTGKTVLNFIDALKQYDDLPWGLKFAVCSLLNGMSEETEEYFRQNEIDVQWLVKIKASPDSDETYTCEPKCKKRTSDYEFTEKHISGKVDPRKGLKAKDYKMACTNLAKQITAEIPHSQKQRIAVIGTEECMYPAIMTASRLVMDKVTAVTHSTTRSPIVPEATTRYPLFSRYEVDSFYEKGRKTYIYNSDETEYDHVIVVTDSENEDYDFSSFAAAFPLTKKFTLVRWVK
ncbi:phosphoribosyltransferase domain-containing protein [Ruminococcus sp. HUN007]|uniref:phosphoribosyltransferase domain-containing protein n=1 Tax=Ruminococcus sp. HUN007 TaxID=1514668 RepID=UPI0006799A38|nr:phosphoribosyltransferase domain-containing protein [Ruminococcus sp. HUN007]